MQDDSEEANSQQDSDVEPVLRNVELSEIIPSEYVPVPRTFGLCPLNSEGGKNPIGAPSTMKIEIERIENEEYWSDNPKQFKEIDSHKQRPTAFNGMQFQDIETFDREHPLKKIFDSTSWNNIPIPLKDCIHALIKAMVSIEKKDYRRKKVVNDRLIQIHQCNDKLKKRLKLVLAESRAQGVFIQEQIADILPQCMTKIDKELAQAKIGMANQGQDSDEKLQQLEFEAKKMVREQQEKLEKVDLELQNFSTALRKLQEELPSKISRSIKDYITKWEKMPMPEEQPSDKVAMDIKDYLTLLPNQFCQEIQSLEGKLVDRIDAQEQSMQQDFKGRIDLITNQQLELNDQIRIQLQNQILNLQNDVELSTKAIRQEIQNEGAQIRKEEEERRIRERPSSNDLRAKEQREMDLFKELMSAGGSKDDPVNNKIAHIVKMISQIKEEFVPLKIQRAIEQMDGKMEINGAKYKKVVQEKIAKVEENYIKHVEKSLNEFKRKLGNPFQNESHESSIYSPQRIDSKRSIESGGDYMEVYVQNTVKTRIDPLDDILAEKIRTLTEVQTHIDQFEMKIQKMEQHFSLTIRAICSTMGLVIKDVQGFDIQQAFLKKLDNEQIHRRKLKLGANVDDRNEFLKVQHQNDSEHHNSGIESEISDIDKQFTSSVESVEQMNNSINCINPKQWRVKEKKFTLKGIEQKDITMDTRARVNQSLDDSLFDNKPKSQNRQYELISPRQQVVHTSGKQEARTLFENFLPPMKKMPSRQKDEQRIPTTVQLTERYQQKTEFASLQFPDVAQAQRSVNEALPNQRYHKPRASNAISTQQNSLVMSANLNIKRAKLPNK